MKAKFAAVSRGSHAESGARDPNLSLWSKADWLRPANLYRLKSFSKGLGEKPFRP
jgi:hypothetical protein